MSTKTTFKRIALVAVAALGVGLLSTVPSSAARTLAGISNLNNITVSTNFAPVTGGNGNSAIHTFTYVSDSITGSVTISPVIRLTSKPSTSSMSSTKATYTSGAVLASGDWSMVTSSITQTLAQATTFIASGGADIPTQGQDLAISTANQAGLITGKNAVHARYDVAGSYVWTVFDDTNGDGIVDAGDFSRSFTVVVSGASNSTAAVGTLSAISSSSAVAGANGSLVLVTLKDAAGNPVAPDTTAGVRITVSGSGKVSAVNRTAVTAVSSYTLGAGSFNGKGVAYVNITNAVAETVSVNVENAGLSSFTAPAAASLTFRTITATSAAPTALLDAVIPAGTAPSFTYDGTARTVSFKTNTAAATYDRVTVTDASGAITGAANNVYDLAVLGSTTADDKGSFSLAFAAVTTTSTTFVVNAGATQTLAYAASTITSLSVTVGSSQRAAAGGSVSFTVRARDQYSVNMASRTITAAIVGRNSAVTVATGVTNSSGVATLTYTDASTSTTSLTDTITFTSGSLTATASVSWTTAANLGVTSISLVTPSETTAGTVNFPAVNSAIYAGDGAEGGAVSVTATVKDANGIVLAGIPISFTVSGTTTAISSNTKTVVTNSLGVATASLYAWATGSYTVTATYGTVSDIATSSWSQADGANYARTLTVVTTNNSAIATVKDRFGNPISGVALTASRVGTGTFAGVTSVTGSTIANGTVEFVLVGGTAEVTVAFSSTTFGQSDALLGLVDGTTATNVFTATTVGTTTTGEVGVGASFSPAGNNSAMVVVAGDTAAADTAQAAADAAAEATDAANAATDAANAAAEAADAATAAAQDAADAVAALSTQVATYISNLRMQITALTNLVIKIQKKVKA